MFGRLEQKTEHANGEMYEFQKYYSNLLDIVCVRLAMKWSFKSMYYSSSKKYVNKDINTCCAAGATSGCICWCLVNLTPNTINSDEFSK